MRRPTNSKHAQHSASDRSISCLRSRSALALAAGNEATFGKTGLREPLLRIRAREAKPSGAAKTAPRFGPRRRRFIFGEFVLLGSPAAVAAAL